MVVIGEITMIVIATETEEMIMIVTATETVVGEMITIATEEMTAVGTEIIPAVVMMILCRTEPLVDFQIRILADAKIRMNKVIGISMSNTQRKRCNGVSLTSDIQSDIACLLN